LGTAQSQDIREFRNRFKDKMAGPPCRGFKKNMLFDEDPNQIPRRYD
jgi:hypothetical protein